MFAIITAVDACRLLIFDGITNPLYKKNDAEENEIKHLAEWTSSNAE